MFLITLITKTGRMFAKRIVANNAFQAQRHAEQQFNARAIRVVEALTK